MRKNIREFYKYQELARNTRLPSANEPYAIIGFPAEVGEVCGKIAKYIRDGGSRQQLREDLKKELGDCLWFIAALADDYQLTLEEIAQANIEKLTGRKNQGTIQGSGDDR